MSDATRERMMREIQEGRTDRVFEWTANGGSAGAGDSDGVTLLQWCAYYGDVSGIRHLLAQGATLESLGANYDLNGAVFHGHWRLCQYLLERGANPNLADPVTGETPAHSCLCTMDRSSHDIVLKLLLEAGADPNAATKPGEETGGFMRDVRTRGETPLHRAAAFGNENTIQMLLEAGAKVDVRDVNGDSPLGWASWHLRPAGILRLLCFGNFRVRAEYQGMRLNLIGKPVSPER